MTEPLITVFGGSGFLGRRIVRRLVDGGTARIRVAVRDPRRAEESLAGVPGVACVAADVRDQATIAGALTGAQAVVNAVGLYQETAEATFEQVHVRGAAALASEAMTAGDLPLVHLSGIGTDPMSPSPYIRARAAGEDAVRAVHGGAVILRPSVLFGEDDAFLGSLVRLVERTPMVPLFGAGATRLQPVHVDDVARAVARTLADPSTGGRVFELGGAQVYTYKALIRLVAAEIGRRPLLLPVPFALWHLLAALMRLLPPPPLTRDMLALVARDNIVAEDLDGIAALGITPRALEPVLASRVHDRR